MKLLFIYGPPAAGKLTVAQEIANKSNFKLFHNHLTKDLAKEIFEDKNVQQQVVARLRLDVIEAAAEANINLIFTMVYAKHEDDDFVLEIVSAIERNGGQIYFVQLIPDIREVEKRVGHASRQAFSKIKDVVALREVMTSYDLYSAASVANNLTINNTTIKPDIVANQIIEHFKLNS